jgi:hypothetical protein
MSMKTNVPLTITPEATAYVAELGLQREFEEMLTHALQTIPKLRELEVELQPAYDDIPCVLLLAERDDPHPEADRTADDWGRWKRTTFPPEVGQHFVLLVNYGWPDAR